MEPTPPSFTVGSNLLRPRPGGARRWLVIVSLVAHTAAIGAYLVVGMFRIERLKPERGRLEVSVARQMNDPGGGLEPGARPEPPKPQVKKEDPPVKVVTEHVQPVDQTKVDPDQTPSTGQTGPVTGQIGPGKDANPPGELCTGPDCGECTGPDCVSKPPVTAPIKTAPVVVEPKFLGPTDLKKIRITGDTQIAPDQVTRTAMSRDGKSSWVGVVKLCIDTSGRVKSAGIEISSGYPAYDALLISGVRSWTYRAHTVNGTPVPVCSNVRFNFSMQ